MSKENESGETTKIMQRPEDDKHRNGRVIACHALTMATIMVVAVAIITGVVVLAMNEHEGVAKVLAVAFIVGIGCISLVRLERK